MKTAVEWLVAELVKTIDYDNSENVEDLRIKLQSFIITSEKQAKELDKQQKIDAWNDGNCNTDLKGNPSANYALSAEHYYNKKYGNETTQKLE